jgi:GDP/UDP-N,N'-diacetylbacillosamine 2-epimerase (hydrolysing)
MKKIFFFTSSRSDFGIQLPLIKKFSKSKKFKTYTIITGSHFDKKFGYSFNEIKKNKILNKILFKINYNVNNPVNISSFLSKILIKISKTFYKLKPDYLVVLGDRFEIIVPAMAANHFKIPIIHLHGGEVTEGSMDEFTRHAVSKMSHIHFPSTANYKKRLIQLGENPKNIYNFGSISLSDIKNIKIYKKKDLLKKLQIKNSNKNMIVTFHPEFLFDLKTTKKNFTLICKVLSTLKNFNIVFTAPAQELNSNAVIDLIKDFCKKNINAKYIESLGRTTYFSCLKNFDVLLGNSSSGIIEAPYFNIPVINIGKRQSGRDYSLNIINCNYTYNDLLNKINYATSKKFKNKIKKSKAIYFQKNTVDKIYKKILNLRINENLSKKFKDL